MDDEGPPKSVEESRAEENQRRTVALQARQAAESSAMKEMRQALMFDEAGVGVGVSTIVRMACYQQL